MEATPPTTRPSAPTARWFSRMPYSGADRARSRLVRLGATIILLAGCGSGTEPRRATVLAIVSPPPGAARSGVVFDAGPVVELRDQDGGSFAEAGVPITASLAEQTGAALGGTITRATDAIGRATFTDLSIGGTTGSYTLRFSAPGLSTVVISTPIALGAGPAATMTAVSPLTPQATVGTPMAALPSVVIKDASGNVVPNVAVTFAGVNVGMLTGATQMTNAAGVATLGGWTLPTASGFYPLSASAAGLAPSSVIFTATATADAPTVMQPASGQGQSSLYGSRLAAPLQVRVVDQYGNPTAGVVVTWGSVTGAGTAEPIDVTTDAGGIARANYRLGTTPGANVVRASINPRNLSADFTAAALGFSTQMGAAIHDTCALDDAGVAWCWGDNSEGQLGDNSTTNRAGPTAVGGALRFSRLSVGAALTCALATDGAAYCWGSNRFAAIGDGTDTGALVPTAAVGGLRFTEISTSGRVTCALTTAGAAWCWGSNEYLSLGVGNQAVGACPPSLGYPAFACSRVPMPVAGGLTFTSIAVGLTHVCARRASGELYCWGNRFGFGGAMNGAEDNWGEPVPAAAGFAFAEVTAGISYTCGIVAPSSAYCWGSGSYGELGTGQVDQQLANPELLPGIAVTHIDAGWTGTCATLTDGRAACWGYNQTGAVGDGTTVDRTTPTTVASGETFTAIGTSGYHACGRVANGQVYCWGDNSYGELGSGTRPDTKTPILARP